MSILSGTSVQWQCDPIGDAPRVHPAPQRYLALDARDLLVQGRRE